ncbi:hypothetical protein DFH07DRAFT_723987, partial [Mycena maculata]
GASAHGEASSHGSDSDSESHGAGGGELEEPISTVTISTRRGSLTAKSYNHGGGAPLNITSGPFLNRTEGGGNRAQVFSGWQYGSGYPGISQPGVVGRDLPFYFWPVVWSNVTNSSSYLHNTSEYGTPNDTNRPGGPLFAATFKSNGSAGNIFRLLADNATVNALVQNIGVNCSSYNISSTSAAFDPANNPQPEEVIAYYRASSAALSLDGYNNTAVFSPVNAIAVPLLGDIDNPFTVCLNMTIQAAIPLV